MTEARLQALLPGLRAALAAHPALEPLADEPPRPLADTGLAHWHVRLGATDRLARIPKQSQMRLSASANLAYQVACFGRAQPSGATPRLHAALAPAPDLPMGALIVDHVAGRPARLPEDLDALVEALARIHALALPDSTRRPPLLSPRDPLAAMLTEIQGQARHLEAAAPHPDTLAAIREDLEAARRLAAGADRPARCLIAFDAHPGNFLIRPNGAAILVDLEKARYGPPGFDLAHATLYTSTTWDVNGGVALTREDCARAARAWAEAVPAGLARGMRGWVAPLRRMMWLWSVTWCAQWRVLSGRPARDAAASPGSAEDWSGDNSAAALVAHVRGRVDHYLDPGIVARVRADWADPASPLRDL